MRVPRFHELHGRGRSKKLIFAAEWSLYDEAEGIDFEDTVFPCVVRNRRREVRTVNGFDELIAHCDCQRGISTINNLLASRVMPDDKFISPESLITYDSKLMLTLFSRARRFGVSFLFPSQADMPIYVQHGFEIIHGVVEKWQADKLRPKE